MSLIYGIDTTKEVTAEAVRRAIERCFFLAHCEQSELDSGDKLMSEGYCNQIVRKAFKETNGDYDHPTKPQIELIMKWLSDFSKSFRNQEIIKKHMEEIHNLLELVKE